MELQASLAAKWTGKVEALKKADSDLREALEVTALRHSGCSFKHGCTVSSQAREREEACKKRRRELDEEVRRGMARFCAAVSVHDVCAGAGGSCSCDCNRGGCGGTGGARRQACGGSERARDVRALACLITQDDHSDAQWAAASAHPMRGHPSAEPWMYLYPQNNVQGTPLAHACSMGHVAVFRRALLTRHATPQVRSLFRPCGGGSMSKRCRLLSR